MKDSFHLTETVAVTVTVTETVTVMTPDSMHESLYLPSMHDTMIHTEYVALC